jgi:hypothetical protein
LGENAGTQKKTGFPLEDCGNDRMQDSLDVKFLDREFLLQEEDKTRLIELANENFLKLKRAQEDSNPRPADS